MAAPRNHPSVTSGSGGGNVVSAAEAQLCIPGRGEYEVDLGPALAYS